MAKKNNNKKKTINPINKKDNKCLQYTIAVELNHEEIEKHPERITKTKPFIKKYNWEGIFTCLNYYFKDYLQY